MEKESIEKLNRREKFQRKMEKRRIITFSILTLLIIVVIALLSNTLIKNIKKTDSNNEILENQEESQENELQEGNNESESKEIVVSAAGDCTLGQDDTFSYYGSFNNQIEKYNYDYSQFLKNVSDIFKNDDYTICNLETTFTDSTKKREKGDKIQYHFKATKECAAVLTTSSIEGVTIANNHIYDYGNSGFKDTIDTLKTNNIDFCGEGYKIVKEIKGIKIAFLGYTAWENTSELKSKITSDITELKNNNVQIIIPYFHWGMEGQYRPCEVQEQIGRFTIDSGADVVLGSHSHVIQSLENYKDKLIVYSFGNFCFGGNSNPTDKNTFILQIKFNVKDDKVQDTSYKIIPCSISSQDNFNDYTPTILSQERANMVIKTMNEGAINLKNIGSQEYFTLKNEE